MFLYLITSASQCVPGCQRSSTHLREPSMNTARCTIFTQCARLLKSFNPQSRKACHTVVWWVYRFSGARYALVVRALRMMWKVDLMESGSEYWTAHTEWNEESNTAWTHTVVEMMSILKSVQEKRKNSQTARNGMEQHVERRCVCNAHAQVYCYTPEISNYRYFFPCTIRK